MCLKTPLYDMHVKLGGKIVPFAGYYLPIQYPTGLITEHMAVRNACGLFDVSHMGEVFLRGKDALNNLQMLLTNNMDGMAVGRCRYSPMCNENGGVVDDLLVCKLAEETYMLIVNAANKEKDVAWIQSHLNGDVIFEDRSDDYALFALQGPRAHDVLLALMKEEDIPQKNYTIKTGVLVAGFSCMVSYTGYTGEQGYEVYCAPDQAMALMEKLLKAGEPFGLLPCGLGARDTLRLEASMPLYGHEMNDEITPLEASLDFFVKMDKADFIGKKALVAKGEPSRVRVGLEVTDRGIVREQCALYAGDKQVGFSTSGTMLPFTGKAMAMAIVEKDFAEIGTELEADVRGRRISVKVVPMPFYKRSK